MTIIGSILAGVGGIIMFIYGIILIIKAFKVSIWWGLGSIFIPFCSLVFVIMNWQLCKKTFLTMMVGAVLYAIGLALIMPKAMEAAKEQQKIQQKG